MAGREMALHPLLSAAAEDPRWWSAAARIRELASAPDRVGFSSRSEVIETIARLRENKPSGIISLLDALTALERLDLSPDDPGFRAGIGHVLQLRRLQRLDPAGAEAVKSRVVRGEITQAELRRLCQEAEAIETKPPVGLPPPHTPLGRAWEFERMFGVYLAERLTDFTQHTGAYVTNPARGCLLMADFVIWEADTPAVAFEVKTGGRLAKKQIFQIFTSLIYYHKFAPSVWLIVPETWRINVSDLGNMIRTDGASNINVGVFHVDQGVLECV